MHAIEIKFAKYIWKHVIKIEFVLTVFCNPNSYITDICSYISELTINDFDKNRKTILKSAISWKLTTFLDI